MKNLRMKIIVTGGGTGGHVKPLMAVVSELTKHKADILYIGSGLELERQEAKKQKIIYKKILTGKYRRYFDVSNFIDILKVIIGFVQAFFIILFFWPKVVFAKGGYVSLPVTFAAWILHRPIVAHETDVVPGMANRLIINKCKKLCVGFPARYYENLPASKIVYTGNPIDKRFFIATSDKQQATSRKDTKYEIRNTKRLVKNDKRKTILITGGSQGSRFINQTIAAILGDLTKRYNIIHICGKLDYEWLSKNKWNNYQLFDFTDKIADLMKTADLIISRSGGAIMEIAASRKPAILIPLPSSAGNHQEMNARVFERANAAIVLREKGLTPESLLEIINRILEDKNLQHELGQKISQFSQPDAAEMISEEILTFTVN